MATQTLLKVGKGALDKKMGKEPSKKDSGDAYKYWAKDHRGRAKLKRKDLDYFMYELCIPRNDAKVLLNVMNRARKWDGKQFLGMRFGRSGALQLIPEVGDVISGLVSMSIIRSASKVSDGLDDGYRNKMMRNVIIEIAVGLVPIVGDLIDSLLFQANTRNFRLLESMLIKRAKSQNMGEVVEGSEPIGHHTTEHHDRHTRTATPTRYDDRHAGLHKRLQSTDKQNATTSDPSMKTNSGGRGWLSKASTHGKRMARIADSAPVRPARPAPDTGRQGRVREDSAPPSHQRRPVESRRHQGGSF